jgi:hypothetical protein
MVSMSEKYNLEIETKMVGTVVRPGDVLILCMSRRMSMQECEDAEKYISSRLPGVTVLFINQCDGMAVYREDVSDINHPDNPYYGLMLERKEKLREFRAAQDKCPACGSSGEAQRGCQNLWHIEVRGASEHA